MQTTQNNGHGFTFGAQGAAIFLAKWNISNVFKSKKRDASPAQDPILVLKEFPNGPTGRAS